MKKKRSLLFRPDWWTTIYLKQAVYLNFVQRCLKFERRRASQRSGLYDQTRVFCGTYIGDSAVVYEAVHTQLLVYDRDVCSLSHLYNSIYSHLEPATNWRC